MSTLSLLNAANNSGFYKAPVTKFLVGTFTLSHIAFQIPAVSVLQKYLICKIPESLSKSEWLRIFTAKLVFLDTKDAIFCILLLYYFRIFERRLGSRKFSSQLLANLVLTGCLELAFCLGLHFFNYPSRNLFAGPVGAVLPWLVSYYYDIPNLSSSTFGGLAVSSKIMTYIMALQVAASSPVHLIGSVSALISGLLYRSNFLWLQKWFVVPRVIANITQLCFGWIIESSPPEVSMIGATLEIQRAQQIEALEQQIIQQQIIQSRRQGAPRAQVGQGFAERLVEDRWAAPFQNFGGFRGGPQVQQQRQQVEPSEENIRLLTDMGFSIDRARSALRESNNDLQLATTVLLRE